jgi:hypothetical protein
MLNCSCCRFPYAAQRGVSQQRWGVTYCSYYCSNQQRGCAISCAWTMPSMLASYRPGSGCGTASQDADKKEATVTSHSHKCMSSWYCPRNREDCGTGALTSTVPQYSWSARCCCVACKTWHLGWAYSVLEGTVQLLGLTWASKRFRLPVSITQCVRFYVGEGCRAHPDPRQC